MASEQQKFIQFWEYGPGREVGQNLLSSGMAEDNVDLMELIVSKIYQQDIRTVEGVKDYLFRCQKSIQQAIATI